jgi:chromosomal replication initiator protein
LTEVRSPQQIWKTALGELQIQVNKSNYRTWLEKTVGLRFRDNTFIIGVPNTFVAEYLEKNQSSLIEKVISGLTHQKIKIMFEVDHHQPENVRRSKNTSPQQADLPLFNTKYTFNSFIVSSCNQLAYAASLGIAQSPGHSYNPLFIHAGGGLGKTHLLQAIGNMAQENNFRALYVSAEQYTNELMTAIQEKKTQEFRKKYRGVDMLLVDDVQFFSGKKQTGESFFHTFDELHNANRQIAITSDRPPKSIPQIPDRLRSRFEWGLVTDIQPPDFDTRLSILQTKSKQDGMNIAADVLELIALEVQENIRALEGALNRVVAYAKLIRSMLTPELAARALKDIAANEEPSNTHITPNLIMEAVVNSFRLTPSDLKGRKRDEATALARQVAMYLLRQETDYSLAEIGRELGGRSPATISHSYQKIAGELNNSPSLRRKVFDIQQKIYSSPPNGSSR